MDDKVLIARRVASELKDGSLVNLGIGLPTMVPRYLPPGIEVYFQSENGIIGMAPVPGAGMEEPSLTDAGGGFVGAIPGAASIDSCLSFGLIRGGHLDLTILGGLEVDEQGMAGELDGAGQDVAGNGRCHGSGDRRKTGYCRHVPHGEGQTENTEALHSAFDLSATSQPDRDRNGCDRTDRGRLGS